VTVGVGVTEEVLVGVGVTVLVAVADGVDVFEAVGVGVISPRHSTQVSQGPLNIVTVTANCVSNPSPTV
jgi:hypothetical protein